jgi:hypothetical protein
MRIPLCLVFIGLFGRLINREPSQGFRTLPRRTPLDEPSSVHATPSPRARAQAPRAEAPAAATPTGDAKRAKELFQEGTRFFDLGQFDKAIESWQAGYREKPDPGFLYNIAQAYRLSGDAAKAIFFYRGYLRNSPKAHNRPEVEQKIATLQKQLADGEHGRSTPAAGPAKPEGPPPGAPAAASAGTAAGSPATPTAASGNQPPPTGLTPAVAAAPPARPSAVPNPQDWPADHAAGAAAPRPFKLDVGIGIDGWSSGVRGNADPSFALMVGAGYTLSQRSNRPVQLRLGGAFGYTFLQETASKETFSSLLFVPAVVWRVASRLSLSGELGVGVLAVSGLKPGSSLLAANVTNVSGTLSMLEFRPAIDVDVHLTPGLGLFLTGAIDRSPQATHFYQPISRSELLIGLSLRR